MKNDLVLSYRSLKKPRPLWAEVGLYGGYEFIEVAEGVWYPRSLEYLIRYCSSGNNMELRELARKELVSTEKVFHPSTLQQEDYLKLKILLKDMRVVALQGYSLAAEDFFSQFVYTTVYTDADYHLPNMKAITTEQLCELSAYTLTLVNCKSLGLKQNVRNWGNVIVYDSNFFCEPNSLLCIGG